MSFAWPTHVNLKKIVGGADFTADADAGYWIVRGMARNSLRPRTNLAAKRCGGRPALANYKDQIRFAALHGQDIALPVVERAGHIGDSLAVVRQQPGIK